MRGGEFVLPGTPRKTTRKPAPQEFPKRDAERMGESEKRRALISAGEDYWGKVFEFLADPQMERNEVQPDHSNFGSAEKRGAS